MGAGCSTYNDQTLNSIPEKKKDNEIKQNKISTNENRKKKKMQFLMPQPRLIESDTPRPGLHDLCFIRLSG